MQKSYEQQNAQFRNAMACFSCLGVFSVVKHASNVCFFFVMTLALMVLTIILPIMGLLLIGLLISRLLPVFLLRESW